MTIRAAVIKNSWRECADELAEAEAAWFDGDDHEKYLAWVHKWTAFVQIGLLATADEVDGALKQRRVSKERDEARPA